MYILEFELGGVPTLVNAQSRAHWAIQHREATKWKRWVFFTCKTRAPAKPLKLAKLKFTRCTSVRPDCDNLAHSFKHVRDALIECGIILNDSPDHVICEYGWEKALAKKSKIRVRIEELP